MSVLLRRLKLLIILAFLLGTGCRDLLGANTTRKPRKQQLTIFAAASLAEAFTNLGDEFESSHLDVDVVISFAGSQQIAQQLTQGAPGDLFASANEKQMDNVINSGRVKSGADLKFIHNQLTLILPGDNPGRINEFGDITRSDLQLILADESVPAGAYSLQMLERANQLPGFDEQFKSRVLENVVSYEENVRAVLTKIILGEADAGIVYVSDAAGTPEVDIQMISIPDAINVTASYYVAPISDSPNEQLAQDFISLVLSPSGQDILKEYGFVKLGAHE